VKALETRSVAVKLVAKASFPLVLIFLLAACASRVHAQADSQFDALAARATEARTQQNLPQAIELYGEALKAKPGWAEGWFYRGLLLYRSNGFASAIDAFNHFLQIQPGVGPALALRGLSEFETGAYADALRDISQGVAKGAGDQPGIEAVLRFRLAELLGRSGRFEDAMAQYAFFGTHPFKDPDLLVAIGLAGMRIPDLPKNVPADKRPFLESVGGAGYAYLSGDTDAADHQFNDLFARYPTTPNLNFFYGSLLYNDSPALAIEQFRAEVEHVPSNIYAHAVLAFTLTIAGRFAEARPEAEIALAASPDMEMAQIALGRALADTGDVKRTTELLNKVLEKDPNNLEAHMGLADVYSRAGRREDAYRERMLCLSLAK
jgi:tetratricopeptide (TPR) repeat protein